METFVMYRVYLPFSIHTYQDISDAYRLIGNVEANPAIYLVHYYRDPCGRVREDLARGERRIHQYGEGAA